MQAFSRGNGPLLFGLYISLATIKRTQNFNSHLFGNVISLILALLLNPSLDFQLPVNIIWMSHQYVKFNSLKLNQS